MTQDPTSLDRLHDIVLPPTVPWWPLAPGWYVLLGLLTLAAAWLAWRFWQRWRANAYRRAALRELTALRDAPAIAELLRRTALAVAPRAAVAEKTGNAWADWLVAQSAEAMSPEVRQLLSVGVYGPPVPDREVSALRDYAARWISRHRSPHHQGAPDAPRPD
jgi:hypothetical protein